ncbi:Zinc phosphodiesterase ELAC protein 2 [Mactra antiquata]
MFLRYSSSVAVCLFRTKHRPRIQAASVLCISRHYIIYDLAEKMYNRQTARSDRYKKKLKEDIPVSSTARLEILSPGCHGQGRCVLLRTALDRYLFNCTEGTQRHAVDIPFKIGPVYNIFFTYNSWNNVGGLLGLMLGMTDSIAPANKFLLHGPESVDAILEFKDMFSENSVRGKHEWRGIEHKQYEDNQLTVDYVELVSSKSCTMSPPSSPKQDTSNGNGQSRISRNDEKTVMAYIIKLKELRPKVDPEKLHALGIKTGPWLKQIINMETVTFDDGKVVEPDDVLMEGETGCEPLIILDCPSEDYLDSLLSHEQFINFKTIYGTQPHMIIHMAPSDIVNNSKYKQFMDRFEERTIHLMLNENSQGPYLLRSQENQELFHQIHPKIFPELHPVYDKQPEPQDGNLIQGLYSLAYTIRPKKSRGFQWDEVLYSDKSLVYDKFKQKAIDNARKYLPTIYDEDEMKKWDNISEETIDEQMDTLRNKLAELEPNTDISNEYPEVTFLGTGSAKPSIDRSSSCILVQLKRNDYMIMDCGEGSLLQMFMLFGKEKTEHILSNLKAVFVSHLHFDHHGGLFSIAEERERVIREQGRKDRLLVLAPVILKKWDYFYSRKVSGHQSALQILHFDAEMFTEIVKQKLDLIKVSAMPVNHTSTSYGLAITHRDGWKLAYSGDCTPSGSLIEHGQDCDLLIHEGTFDDSQIAHARVKRHSTTSQALEVAEKMNAKFTILTHFSQRFNYIPLFTDKFTDNVGFSFDFMQVRPSLYKSIPLLKPLLDIMFGAQVRKKMDVTNESVEEQEEKLKKLYSMKNALHKNEIKFKEQSGQSSNETTAGNESKNISDSTTVDSDKSKKSGKNNKQKFVKQKQNKNVRNFSTEVDRSTDIEAGGENNKNNDNVSSGMSGLTSDQSEDVTKNIKRKVTEQLGETKKLKTEDLETS